MVRGKGIEAGAGYFGIGWFAVVGGGGQDCPPYEMIAFRRFLDAVPFWVVIAASLTLGLAPFTPEPHIWEKLKMLFSGAEFQTIDIFDMVMHGAPFVLLALKLAFWRRAG